MGQAGTLVRRKLAQIAKVARTAKSDRLKTGSVEPRIFRWTIGNDGSSGNLAGSWVPRLSAKMSGIILTGRKLGFMDQLAGLMGSRRNEDIALDMMKFIAATTGYGKTGSPGAGFQGGTVNKAEDYAEHLLDLYARCLNTVNGKK